MADIGDDYTVNKSYTDSAGSAIDPATVTLTVTDPSGDTSTPPVSNPAVGSYTATIPLDEAGRWLYVWTATSPGDVDHGHVDVSADPPSRLFPLATTADIEARLGRDLTTAELARVTALLLDASSAVRGATKPRQDFDLVTGDEIILRPVGTILTLPQKPVTAVTKVEAIGGNNGAADITVTGWRWDGKDEVEIGTGLSWQTVIDYDQEQFDLDCWAPETYRVTYSHGYVTTPDDVKGKCCQLVMRCLTAGSLTEGQTQMTVGHYSEQWQQSTGSMGLTPVMTRADLDDMVRWGYREQASTIGVRT